MSSAGPRRARWLIVPRASPPVMAASASTEAEYASTSVNTSFPCKARFDGLAVRSAGAKKRVRARFARVLGRRAPGAWRIEATCSTTGARVGADGRGVSDRDRRPSFHVTGSTGAAGLGARALPFRRWHANPFALCRLIRKGGFCAPQAQLTVAVSLDLDHWAAASLSINRESGRRASAAK